MWCTPLARIVLVKRAIARGPHQNGSPLKTWRSSPRNSCWSNVAESNTTHGVPVSTIVKVLWKCNVLTSTVMMTTINYHDASSRRVTSHWLNEQLLEVSSKDWPSKKTCRGLHISFMETWLSSTLRLRFPVSSVARVLWKCDVNTATMITINYHDASSSMDVERVFYRKVSPLKTWKDSLYISWTNGRIQHITVAFTFLRLGDSHTGKLTRDECAGSINYYKNSDWWIKNHILVKIIDIKSDLNKHKITSNKGTLQTKQNEIHNKPKNKQNVY